MKKAAKKKVKKPIEVMVTFLAQTNILAKNEDDYQKKLDRLIGKLEKMGFNLSVENESDWEDCEECDEEQE